MQGAETIVKTILDNAKTAAAQTLRTADEKAQTLRQAAQAAQADAEAKAMKRAKEESVEREKRMMRMAELEAKKAELAEKRSLIDQAFAGALEQLCAMDAEKKRQLNRKNLLDCAQGGETFCAAKGDAAALNAQFLENINRELTAAGKPALTLGSAVETIRGGFLLVSSGITYNCSYEAILSQQRDELEAQVAALLFGGAE